MMTKGFICLMALGVVMIAANTFCAEHMYGAEGKSAVTAATPAAVPGADVRSHASCTYCGMNREKFAHSRVLIEYDDGSSVGLCSVRCAAVDLANNLDKAPKSIKVGDYGTRELIDAEQAFWVIGGTKQGVMTRQAKWAFAKKEDAEKFIRENGGKAATFDQVLKASFEDLYQDTKMIRERRKMKRMQMDKK